MSYESSSFSRSSSSSSSSGSEGEGEERRRKVRKKRRKTMTADDMRKGVTFQTGLTGKAKLALLGVIVAGIAITVVVMMAVNGSFTLKGLANDDPGTSTFPEQDGLSLDAFAPEGGQNSLPETTPLPPAAQESAPALPADDISRAFEE
ncbi:MAG: hypothetical protein ACI9R3_003692 [Verrucomicrobiales bacterium]|jgi:hypothetical protein